MQPSERLDQVYARCLQTHPEGHALFKAISSNVMKPGTCGYFDGDGDWRTIVQTTDQNALSADGWTLPKGFQISMNQVTTQTWAPKTSQNIKSSFVTADLSEIPGLSSDVSGVLRYQSFSGPGAVLVTDGEVARQRCQAPQARDWVLLNAKLILNRFPEVRKNGVYIITETYTAKRRAVAVLSGKVSEIILPIKSGIYGSSQREHVASWGQILGDGHWYLAEEDDGVVLFMSGIWWRPRLLSRLLPRLGEPTEKKAKQDFLDTRMDRRTSGQIRVFGKLGPSSSKTVELFPEMIGTVYGLPSPPMSTINVGIDYDYDTGDDEINSADELKHRFAELWVQCRDLWAQELRYPIPVVLQDVTISIVTFDQITVKDRVQCWLEDYTATEWIWHPWSPPRRRAPVSKNCLQWKCDCGKRLSACVSQELTNLLLSLHESKITYQAGGSAAARKNPTEFLDAQSVDLTEAGAGWSENYEGEPSRRAEDRFPLGQRTKSASASEIKEPPQTEIHSKFVLFCIDGANNVLHADTIAVKYSKGSTPVVCIHGDYEFFQALRTKYISLRGKWRYRLDPLQFSFCHFSRFEKWDAEKLGYIKNEFPSNEEYEYRIEQPTEPYYDPISKHEWEQRFYQQVENRYRHGVTNRIPKRAKRFQLTTHVNGKSEILWGLYIQLRPLAWMVFAWQMAILVPGISFMIYWLVAHRDETNQWSIAFAPLTATLAIEGSFLSLWDKYKLRRE